MRVGARSEEWVACDDSVAGTAHDGFVAAARSWIALLLLLSLWRSDTALAASRQARHLRLYVEAGTLMKDGRPYRGIGANYFDLFSRTLHNPRDTSSLDGLRELSRV